MTSPCSFPLKPTIPPIIHEPQDPNIPPPLPPSPLDLALPPLPCSLQASVPPPPPLPPPPSAVEVVPPHVYGLEKSRLLKEALEKASPVPKGREDVKRLLKLHMDRFRSDLQWILFCADLPSLIQEGPQCGLVALWMAGTLLSTPDSVSLQRLVQVAMERGYTMQGEMFSVADMAKLAQETLDCEAELLCGGLGGPNRDRVLKHLISGHPLLIPHPRAREGSRVGMVKGGTQGHTSLDLNTSSSYDEDFNHEPCQKKGHKAHWAVSAGDSSWKGGRGSRWLYQCWQWKHGLFSVDPEAECSTQHRRLDYNPAPALQPHPGDPLLQQGVLIGVQSVPIPGYMEDSELPGLFHPVPGVPNQLPSFPEESSPGAIFLLSKQGKSWHFQLWDYNQVRDSNLQLTDFSPARATDGRAYVVPAGGVQAGLCGQVLLLRPQSGVIS